MKKIIYVTITIIIFVCISMFVQYKLQNSANNILNDITEVTKNMEDENWDVADKQLEDLVNKWEEVGEKWSVLVEHDEIDNITVSLFKSKAYANFREKEEALAEMREFEFMIDHIPKIQKIQLKNIL